MGGETGAQVENRSQHKKVWKERKEKSMKEWEMIKKGKNKRGERESWGTEAKKIIQEAHWKERKQSRKKKRDT